MALPRMALLASLALIASCPAAEAVGGITADTDATCIYPILHSDGPLYILDPRYPGWETFVGVAVGNVETGASYTGAGIMYEGGCASFFIPAKVTLEGGDNHLTCIAGMPGATC